MYFSESFKYLEYVLKIKNTTPCDLTQRVIYYYLIPTRVVF